MRILAITLRYPPYVEGGYEILTHDALQDLRQRGHSVGILCGQGTDYPIDQSIYATLQPALDDAQSLFESDRKSGALARLRMHFFRLANYRATQAAIADFKPDLVLYFNLGLVSLAPLIAARRRGVPTLGYLCDKWIENQWLLDEGKKPHKRGRVFLMRRVWSRLRGFAKISPALCASRWLKEHLVSSGVPASGLGVLHTGLSPTMERLARANDSVLSRAPKQALQIICTSMLWDGKGQHVLVEAFGQAVTAGLDARLVLAGSEPGGQQYRERLDTLAQAAGVAQRIEFVGMLSPEELSAQLSSSHVFVLPSIWGEPFGLCTIEAMAHGLCTVVTNSGASHELVEDAGIIVATNSVEAIREVLLKVGSDEAERGRLGCLARERALEHFGRSNYIDGLETACNSAAGHSPN